MGETVDRPAERDLVDRYARWKRWIAHLVRLEKMEMQPNSGEKGQTLVEVMVALAVVVIVVLALVRVTVASMRNASFARNRALATKYAQEGIEKVRAYRDQTDWATFTSGCQAPPGLSTPPSPFLRTIICSGSGDARDVRVKVEWTGSGGIAHKSELITRLTNWK